MRKYSASQDISLLFLILFYGIIKILRGDNTLEESLAVFPFE
jgi:hypothetical protein